MLAQLNGPFSQCGMVFSSLDLDLTDIGCDQLMASALRSLLRNRATDLELLMRCVRQLPFPYVWRRVQSKFISAFQFQTNSQRCL
jgi:hypothetical protein